MCRTSSVCLLALASGSVAAQVAASLSWCACSESVCAPSFMISRLTTAPAVHQGDEGNASSASAVPGAYTTSLSCPRAGDGVAAVVEAFSPL